jgi:hypothetical protein
MDIPDCFSALCIVLGVVDRFWRIRAPETEKRRLKMILNQNFNGTMIAHADHEHLQDLYTESKCCREWLDRLPIEENLRDYLVEPVAAAELKFLELLGVE